MLDYVVDVLSCSLRSGPGLVILALGDSFIRAKIEKEARADDQG